MGDTATDATKGTDPNAPPPGSRELDKTEAHANEYLKILQEHHVTVSDRGSELHSKIIHLGSEAWKGCHEAAEKMVKAATELTGLEALSSLAARMQLVTTVTNEMEVATKELMLSAEEYEAHQIDEEKHHKFVEGYILLIETFLELADAFFESFREDLKSAAKKAATGGTTGGAKSVDKAGVGKDSKPLTAKNQADIQQKQKEVDSARTDVAAHAGSSAPSADTVQQQRERIELDLGQVKQQLDNLAAADESRRVQRQADIQLEIDGQLTSKIGDIDVQISRADRLPAGVRKDAAISELNNKKAPLVKRQDDLAKERDGLANPDQNWMNEQRNQLTVRQQQLTDQQAKVAANSSPNAHAAQGQKLADTHAKAQDDLEKMLERMFAENVKMIEELSEKVEREEELTREEHEFLREMHQLGHIVYSHADAEN